MIDPMPGVRLLKTLLGFAVLISACGAQADVTGGTAGKTIADAPATTSTTSAADEAMFPSDEFVPDYAALIATVESAMEGTAYQGAAVEDPEVFIATSELFCDLLDEGMTTDQLLAEYLDRLSDGGVVEVGEDDGLMAGVLLGASIEIVCPEFSEEST